MRGDEARRASTEIFSGGGTGTYNIQHLVPGFTDVQVGSYLFMDMQYLAIGSEDGDPVYKDFGRSLTVVARCSTTASPAGSPPTRAPRRSPSTCLARA